MLRPGSSRSGHPVATDIPRSRPSSRSALQVAAQGDLPGSRPQYPFIEGWTTADSLPTVEVGKLLVQELKSHLVAIESKVDEIAVKVSDQASRDKTPRARPPVTLELPNGTPQRRSGYAQTWAPDDRKALRRQSIQAMRRMSQDLRAMGELPGAVRAEPESPAAAAQAASLLHEQVLADKVFDEEGSVSECSTTKTGQAAVEVEAIPKPLDVEASQKPRNQIRRTSVEAVSLGKMRSRVNWTTTDETRVSYISTLSRRFLGKQSTKDLEDKKDTVLWKIVNSVPFQSIVGMGIVLNAIYIGLRADLRLQAEIKGEDESVVMTSMEFVFFSFFAIELLLRLGAEKKVFIIGPEWKWNMFDTLLVLTSLFDAVLNGVTSGNVGNLGNVTAARMVRIVRFVRIVRILRAVRAFQSLRIVVFAIFESMVSLLWCFIVLCLIIYIFAVFLMQGVMEHYSGLVSADAETLLTLYGSVMRAMVTLFMTITGGVDWRDAMIPLTSMHWTYEPIFNFYVFFMVIGVLNVVVGAFVATTAEIISSDRDALVKAEMKDMDSYSRKIKTFFSEADKDKSGKLSWDEFKAHLKIPKVSAYFRALELDVSQAHVVFKLLDADGSNEVSLEEFLAGCLRLKGQAKSIDVNMLLYENQQLFNKLTEFIQFATDILLKDKDMARGEVDVLDSVDCSALLPKKLPKKTSLTADAWS